MQDKLVCQCRVEIGHELLTTGNRRQGEPPGEGLAQHAQVRDHSVELLRSAVAKRKFVTISSKINGYSKAFRYLAESLEEPRRGRNQPLDGFHDHPR